jgi:hypothetical protein
MGAAATPSNAASEAEQPPRYVAAYGVMIISVRTLELRCSLHQSQAHTCTPSLGTISPGARVNTTFHIVMSPALSSR